MRETCVLRANSIGILTQSTPNTERAALQGGVCHTQVCGTRSVNESRSNSPHLGYSCTWALGCHVPTLYSWACLFILWICLTSAEMCIAMQTYFIILCLSSWHFTSTGALYKVKAKPSTSKMIKTHFTVVVWNRAHHISEGCLQC